MAAVLDASADGWKMGEAVNPCSACTEKRVHTVAEWSEFHRYARHGYSIVTGWSLPEFEAAAKERDSAVPPPQE
jgi:hypothetical protein